MAEIKHKSDAGVATLSKWPRIGNGGLGGLDIPLGGAHRIALQIANAELSEVPKEHLNRIYTGVMQVLEKWKMDHGKPPSQTGFTGLLGLGREENLPEVERRKQVKALKPWQCHLYAKTPIALYGDLLASEYEPLREFLNKTKKYPLSTVEALLILASNDPKSEHQTSDCIYAAMSLARFKIEEQKHWIAKISPLARSRLISEKNSKQTRLLKKQAKEKMEDEKVSAAYKELCPDGVKVSAIQLRICNRTGLKQTAVSNSMARLGLATRKSRKKDSA